MNEFLENFYKEDKPKTLCILQALPGLSDDNILSTISLMNSPEHSIKFIEQYHNKTCSLNSEIPNWELVDTEIYKQKECLYDAVVVAYYKPIDD